MSAFFMNQQQPQRRSSLEASRRLSFTSFRLSDIESMEEPNQSSSENPSLSNGAGGAGGPFHYLSSSTTADASSLAHLALSSTSHNNNNNHHNHSGHSNYSYSSRGAQVEPILGHSGKAVIYAKRTIVLAWLVLSVFVTTMTYLVLWNQSTSAFAEKEQCQSHQLMQGVHQILDQQLSILFALSVTYTTTTSSSEPPPQASAAVWPNVTLPHFPLLTRDARFPTQFGPILRNEQERRSFEAYATATFANQQQQRQAQDYTKTLDHPVWVVPSRPNDDETQQQPQEEWKDNRTIADGIYRIQQGERVTETFVAPFVPVWQVTGRPQSTLLFNQISNRNQRQAIEAMAVTGGAVLSKTTTDDSTLWLHVPVLRNFDQAVTGGQIEGTVAMQLEWKEWLKADVYVQNDNDNDDNIDLLPLEVVVSNTCRQDDQLYLRNDDGTIDRIANPSDVSIPDESYHAIQHEYLRGPCEYTLGIQSSVGPSKQRPLLITVLIGIMWILVLVAFGCYDRLVERRQAQILKTAVQTHAIVQSLFPETVRERILQQQNQRTALPQPPPNAGRNADHHHLQETTHPFATTPTTPRSTPHDHHVGIQSDSDSVPSEPEQSSQTPSSKTADSSQPSSADAALSLPKQTFSDSARKSSSSHGKSCSPSVNSSMSSSKNGMSNSKNGSSSHSSSSSNNNNNNSNNNNNNNNNNSSSSSSKGSRHKSLLHHTPKLRLKKFLAAPQAHGDDDDKHEEFYDLLDTTRVAEPIADLFPHTTVLFADIAGFTAWSSEREPSQVFTLLESLYHAFDLVANKLGVFKVETIGDCYVAVTGLPDPNRDHAVVMARFAFECLYHMHVLTRRLETTLGPGTTDLALRVGLHSGPVTAGVLRGEKSRFQLFGDTMNTAARMESTGQKNRIQVSQDTASLIAASGKGRWLNKRKELVYAKGKGEMQTYWLIPRFNKARRQAKDHHHQLDARPEPGLNASTVPSSTDKPEGTDKIGTEGSDKKEVSPSTTISPQQERRGNGPLPMDVPSRRASCANVSWKAKSERWADSNLEEEAAITAQSMEMATKTMRLVNWNVDLLLQLLTKVVAAKRQRLDQQQQNAGQAQLPLVSPEQPRLPTTAPCSATNHQEDDNDDDNNVSQQQRMILDEVTEIIELPLFDPNVVGAQSHKTHRDVVTTTEKTPVTTANKELEAPVTLNERVKPQLLDYIARIADRYQDNAFHNFEHASHVTMSANKLLKRIIRPDNFDYRKEGENRAERIKALARDLHIETYGISSDPLTQFAIVFSALIHDVDHTGLPNAQLVKEKAEVALKYHNKSVAEQNSLAIAWEMLEEASYVNLRACIWQTDQERRRFRQLLVNAVMATDILDKEQQLIRKKRWDKAFHDPERRLSMDSTEELTMNRKATSVLEHIIQASDVAHTMQHWRIYCKWNQRLFNEMYAAYKAGRSSKDPSLGWYEGEIWFFDNYIIPLAKKLKECGVFGVASDEYLTYALENRKEWEMKGRGVCLEMMEAAKVAHNQPTERKVTVPKQPRRGTIG